MSDARPPHHDPHPMESMDAEIDIRRIGWFLVWLAVGSIVTCVLMYALYRDFQGREERADRPASPLVDRSQPRLPPEPRLQVTAELDLARYRADERTLLESYGWVDEPQRIVRVPIDRAIDLVAAQHLPWREHRAPAPLLPGGIPSASTDAAAAAAANPPASAAAPQESHAPQAPASEPHSGGHP